MSFKQSKELRREVEEWFKLLLFMIAAATAAYKSYVPDHTQVRSVPGHTQVQNRLPPPIQDRGVDLGKFP